MNMKFVKPLLTLLLRLALAVAVAAIVLAGACIMMEGDLEEVMTAFFLGPIEDEYAIAEILREMVPLIFTGVAVSLMVRCGQFNMFVEGAFFGGAFLAGVLAPVLGENFIITPVIAILAAAVAMGLIGYVPAKMKSSLGVNEFVSSLMLNYIVYWVVMYLIHGVAADPDYPNATMYLEDAMRLPFLNEDIELSSNLIIALAHTLPQFLEENSTLLLSGILDTRLPDVLAALQQANLQVTATHASDTWRCLQAKRRPL